MTKAEAEFSVMVEEPTTIYGLTAEAGGKFREVVTPFITITSPDAGSA
jgi:hypothetical protein